MNQGIATCTYPGATIRELRTKLGWSQRRLAKMCHPPINHSLISRLERGGKSGYTQNTLQRIAKVFGVTIQYLFMPDELKDYLDLPMRKKIQISKSVKAAIAKRYLKLHKTQI